MMRQLTFSNSGFEVHRKSTRRERFLAEMEAVVPWGALRALVEPHYPKGERGRPPIGIERMLRIYFLQQWFNLSDPQAEDAIYDIAPMRSFVGIDLGREAAPDETTICKFRHLIETHGLVAAISSVAGYAPLFGRSGYAASKHALHGFFYTLRTEVEDRGVGVTLVCPSFIATGIGGAALGGTGT